MFTLASRRTIVSLLLIISVAVAGLAILTIATVYAAEIPSHVYEFNDDLTDELGGPSLVDAGGTINATDYSFGPNQGLSLSNALVDSDNYSIETVFNFSNIDTWRKIIDFKDLTSNFGLYNSPDNRLYFFPRAAGPTGAIRQGVSVHLVITRNATTDQFIGYIEGVQQFSFTDIDSRDEAVFSGPNSVIQFFKDDFNGAQASAGVVDRIRIYDGVLSPSEVVALQVRISPRDDATSSGETIAFTASEGTAPFTFTIRQNNSGATIDASSGLYTAGNNQGIDIVRVTDANGDFAEAQVFALGPLGPLALTHDYEFNGVFTDAKGGPSLVSSGGTINATDYSFGPNQGLSLSNALLNTGNYSIETVFNFSNVDNWRKIIDFKDLTSNSGLYNSPLNRLYFVPRGFGPTGAIRQGVSVHLVITRDATNDQFIGYIDGVQQFSFTDSAFESIFTGTNAVIQFFKDDSGVSQTSAGVVDRIRIYDGVLTSVQVAALQVRISPRDDAASSGETITFSASEGTGPFTFSITQNNSGATIDSSSGIYTAGGNIGLDVVRVTDDANGDIAEATVIALGPLSLDLTLTHEYEFNGDLTDELGGPPLVDAGGTINATDYSFGPNQGLSLSNALVNTGNYSIETVFNFSNVDAWRKIIDFKDLTSNFGLYNSPDNRLYFYPRGFGQTGAIQQDVNVHLVITRDATNGQFIGYIDGVLQFSFTDSAFEAIFSGPHAVIQFFKDDFNGAQASAGVVDLIRIYDGVLVPSQIVDLFNGIGDADEDGVPNESDLCSNTPDGIPVNSDGCGFIKITGGGQVNVDKELDKNHSHSFGFNIKLVEEEWIVNLEYNDNHTGKPNGKKKNAPAPPPLQYHVNNAVATAASVLLDETSGEPAGLTVTVPCEKRRLGGLEDDENTREARVCVINVLDNGEPGKGTDKFILTPPPEFEVNDGDHYNSVTVEGGDTLNKGNIQAHYEEPD